MAVITIPSSINGISIPGALVNGPLGALFGKTVGIDSYKYPRDLDSATRGHIVHFSVMEVQPYTIDDVQQLLNINPNAGLVDNITNVTNAVENFAANVANGSVSTNSLSFGKPNTKQVATISLYMPDTVNFQYNANYNDMSVTGLISDVAGKLPLLGGVVSNLVSGNGTLGGIAKIGLNQAGYAINPQQQLMFDGVQFRTFQLAFTFTPYSQQEASDVTKIINLFRKHAAPEIKTAGTGGMFFVVPSQFDISFLFNGKDNPNINKVERCVLENIDVNYAPNGWSAHNDGAPVQTTLTLQFKEIILVDKTEVNKGY